MGALRMTEVPKVNRNTRPITGLEGNTNCFLLRSSASGEEFFSQGCTGTVGIMDVMGEGHP